MRIDLQKKLEILGVHEPDKLTNDQLAALINGLKDVEHGYGISGKGEHCFMLLRKGTTIEMMSQPESQVNVIAMVKDTDYRDALADFYALILGRLRYGTD